MPERRFDTGFWNDPAMMKLPTRAKLLYIYLWTNRHCNQAGLYEIALETIHFETGLELEEIPDLLHVLEKKVAWFAEQNLVWVKNFLHRQGQSPQFLAAAAKCLSVVTNNNGLIKEFLEYNSVRHTLSIPYQYPIDRVSIPPYAHTDTQAGEKGDKGVKNGVVKGKGKGKKREGSKSAESESEIAAIYGEMRTYLGYPDKTDKDPIPNYGKEGQAIKRMFTRGFTREEVTNRWKRKVDERGGEFVSMVWVNEDIGKPEIKRRGAGRLSSEQEIAESIRKVRG